MFPPPIPKQVSRNTICTALLVVIVILPGCVSPLSPDDPDPATAAAARAGVPRARLTAFKEGHSRTIGKQRAIDSFPDLLADKYKIVASASTTDELRVSISDTISRVYLKHTALLPVGDFYARVGFSEKFRELSEWFQTDITVCWVEAQQKAEELKRKWKDMEKEQKITGGD